MGKKSWGIRNTWGDWKFRSTWERYLAILLVSSGVSFQYEGKRFFLPNGLSYLPDFYIPEFRLFIEVKGFLKEEDKIKMQYFKLKVSGRLITFTQNELEEILGDKASFLAKIDLDKYRPSMDELKRFHKYLNKELKRIKNERGIE